MTRYRWWYKGITPENVKVSLQGTIDMPDDSDVNEAIYRVEREMRAKYPEMRWMQGRRIEDATVQPSRR